VSKPQYGVTTVRVEILIYPGFDEMDARAPFEVLRGASNQGDWQVKLVTINSLNAVAGSHGLRVVPDR